MVFFSFFKQFLENIRPFYDHWYPCFGLLETSALDFKVRVNSLLAWSLTCMQWISQIYLCDTCWPLGTQHCSRAIFDLRTCTCMCIISKAFIRNDRKWFSLPRIYEFSHAKVTCFFKCAFCAKVWKLCLWRIKDFSWSVDARIIVMIANLAVQDTIHYGILFIATSTRLETINSHSLIGKPYLVAIVCNVYRKKPHKIEKQFVP